MGHRRIGLCLACLLILSMLAACGGGAAEVEAIQGAAASSAQAQGAAAAGAATTQPAATTSAAARQVTEVALHTWDAAAGAQIALNGDAIAVTGSGATADGSVVTITRAGTYTLSGDLADGQVIVDTADKGDVLLVLNGVALSSSTSAPIYIANARDVVIVLADGTVNTVTDGEAYLLAADSDEPNAAIFSKADLTIEGGGSLAVDGNYNDGIASKDDLTIAASGSITVSAVDDGIRGKDSLVIQDGRLTVTAGGDGLKADNAQDATRGYVSIAGGVVKVTAGRDAITAQTDVLITAGELTLASGGGSRSFVDESVSAKGIKGLARVVIDGGAFTIDSADDAIHSNGSIVINGGSFVIATGDDGVHADATVAVNGGDIRITACYEGIESAVITINAGEIAIVSSDDALNVAGGNDGSGMMPGPGRRRGAPGAAGQDAFAAASNQYLHINGGKIVIDAAGDGIDINGSVEMTDGVLLINGPTQNMNGALDYDGSFKITGGYLLAVGSAGMAQAPDASSTQYAVLLNLNSAVRAGTLVHIRTSKGGGILTFAPAKAYQSIAFSAPELAKGATYEVYFGGSSTGTEQDGLYEGCAYAGGSQAGSFTISSIVTQMGSSRMR